MNREALYIKLASVNVDANGNEEDGDETKEDDSVNQDSDAARLHGGKLDHPSPPRNLTQQPWCQQHKQHHRH